MKNEIIDNGFEPTDYKNTNYIATLWIVTIALFICLLVAVCVCSVSIRDIDAYKSRLNEMDSANLELNALNEMLTNNLINK